MEKVTVESLKNKLRAFGAKLSGNKKELVERVQHWTDYQLDRTLFVVPTIPNRSGDCAIFSKLQYTSLEKLQSNSLHWLSKESIDVYFGERAKGESALLKGRYSNMAGYLNDHDYVKENLQTILLNKINNVKPPQIAKLEKKTRKNKRLWHQLRKTRITASIAHDVIRTCRSKRFATSLLDKHQIVGHQKPYEEDDTVSIEDGPTENCKKFATSFLDKPILTKAIKWGIANEETALKAYCDVMGEKFSKCGLYIDTDRNYIAATPDGINEAQDEILEIKCPYSVRQGQPYEVDYLSSGKLKTSHRYYTQMQIQMHVTKVHSCDFVVWTPNGIYIEGIRYDKDLVAGYLNDCDFYFRNVFSKLYFETIDSGN